MLLKSMLNFRFWVGFAKSFDLESLGGALITAVKEVAKILLSTVWVAGNRTLTEKLTGTLNKVLALHQKREDKEVAGRMP